MPAELSIITPCYNEAENIPFLVERFSKLLLESDLAIEIIFVNNGSTDNSLQVFENEFKKANQSSFKICNVKKNQGYGFGILSGLKDATAPFLAWTHADLQTDPKDVLKGYELLKKQEQPLNCFLKGKRKKRNLLDSFFTFGMSIYSSFKLKNALFDINAQPKIFSRAFYETWENPPYDFSLDLYAYYTAKKNGLNILELPVFFEKRQFGEAKGGGTLKGKMKLIKRTLKYINELKKKLKSEESKNA